MEIKIDRTNPALLIKFARLILKLTQDEMSERLGKSVHTIQSYELGRLKVPEKVMEQVEEMVK